MDVLKYILSSLLLFVFLACSTERPTNSLAKFSGSAFEIRYTILVANGKSSQRKIEKAITSVFEEIDRVYNKWNPLSEISQLNRLAKGERKRLSPQLAQFFSDVEALVKLTEGRFDPAIEPLQTLWKEKFALGTVPTKHELEEIAPCLGWDKVHIEEGSFYKDDSRTQIDLGGIAKGLAVDRLVVKLNEAGFKDVFVEWGGEIRATGNHPEGRPWRIFISHLEDVDPNHAIAHLDLVDCAIATSGDYFQKWTVKNGSEVKTYCHIFNPKTHSPLEIHAGSIASASMVANDCTTADALAKVLMMFDTPEQAQQWIEDLRVDHPEMAGWLAMRPQMNM